MRGFRVVDDSGLERAIHGELALMRPDVRGDLGMLEVLLDEDFVEIGASGCLWTRTTAIADLVSSPTLDVKVFDMSARQIGAQIVLVTYTTVSGDRRVLRSSWWRHADGTWKCFFHQGTIAAPTGA